MTIAIRDGFLCGICRERVDVALRFPHPRSMALDHVVPLSAGGSDRDGNVQLAHLGCNARKGRDERVRTWRDR